jgi:tetratricopeptide (TPR) repeat protein
MRIKVIGVAIILAALVGCASVRQLPAISELPWHDETFAYDAKLVSETKDELFRLDAALVQRLQGPATQSLSAPKRLEHLLALLYGAEMKSFPYAAGHSTVAAVTWQQGRGDCLSLTVLAYAMTRELKMSAQMQEVKVPLLFDRRDGVDFANEHVNLLVRESGLSVWTNGRLDAKDMIVDFEPQLGANREGKALSDEAILARFYNNRGAEYLVEDQRALAYAYLKAAILVNPAYPSSYSNLAQLYQRAGLMLDAEHLLRQAVGLSRQALVPLSALHRLLLTQGREAEALEMARLLQSQRERDPYYWIGLGISHLNQGRTRQAIDALEEAQLLTSGFEEVHRYLALAYSRAGEQARASEQLGLLEALSEDGGLGQGRRKKFKVL